MVLYRSKGCVSVVLYYIFQVSIYSPCLLSVQQSSLIKFLYTLLYNKASPSNRIIIFMIWNFSYFTYSCSLCLCLSVLSLSLSLSVPELYVSPVIVYVTFYRLSVYLSKFASSPLNPKYCSNVHNFIGCVYCASHGLIFIAASCLIVKQQNFINDILHHKFLVNVQVSQWKKIRALTWRSVLFAALCIYKAACTDNVFRSLLINLPINTRIYHHLLASL